MKKQRLIIESIRYITGNQDSVKIQGNKRHIVIFNKALNASKKLYESLHRSDVSLNQIEKLVLEKNRWAKKWVKETGESWPF